MEKKKPNRKRGKESQRESIKITPWTTQTKDSEQRRHTHPPTHTQPPRKRRKFLSYKDSV